MSDAETMAYNIEYGETFGTGCVDFNENTWRNWFYLWVNKIYWGCEYMYIKEIHDNKEKIEISTRILKSLPNWFGIPESTQEYISESSNFPFFAAIDESNPLGFISIKENNQYTAEIYVMDVLPNYHKQGIGKALFKIILQCLIFIARTFCTKLQNKNPHYCKYNFLNIAKTFYWSKQ